jgi:hypothetical protein
MRFARLTTFAALLFAVALPTLGWGRGSAMKNATPEELAMKSVPLAPGSPAVILEWLWRQDDTEAYEEEYIRIKVFGQEGKKYGDIEVKYVDGFSNINDIEARTIHADGSIVPFAGKVYDKLIVRSGRSRVKAKTFSLPDIQPGSILEYHYTRHWPIDILLTSHWTVQRELPVLKAQLWLKPYSRDFSSYFTYTGLPAGKKPTLTGDHYELNLTDIPAFEKEPFAPPEEQIKPHVDFYYSRGRVDNMDEYWNNIAKSYADTIESFIGNRGGIKSAAGLLVAGADTPDAKLRRIYGRVQQIRNLTYERSKTEQESSREKLRDNGNVEDVLRNGYGNRDEITRLFIALVRAAGFEASDLAVSQRDEYFFSKTLPDAKQLSGEVALVMVGNQQRFFDPGTPFAPFGTVSWESTNVLGLKLAKKSNAVWVEVPLPDESDAVTKRAANLHLDGDSLKGRVTVTYNGQEALVHRLARRNDDEAASKKAFEELAKGWFPDGATATLSKVTGMKSWDEPLVVELDVELPNVSSTVGSRILVPLSVFGMARKNAFTAERRKYAVYYSYPFQDEDTVTLHLPDGYLVESLPKSSDVPMGAIGYRNGWSWSGNDDVVFTRKVFLKTILVDPANYSIIRGFWSRVIAADQEALVLQKRAAGAAKKGGA